MLIIATVLATVVPGLSDTRAWIAGAALVVVVGAVSAVAARSLPLAAVPLLVYLAVYAVAGLHGQGHANADIARYVVRPLFAVAVSAVALGARRRYRVLLVIVAAACVEAAVAVVEGVATVIRYGRGGTPHADSVTGTLGTGQAAVLTFLCLLAACLALGAWLRGTHRTSALVVAALALLAGIATSTRAIVAVVPVVVVSAAVVFLAARAAVPLRRLVPLALAALVAVPVLYGGIALAYRAAFASGLSAQSAPVLGGPAGESKKSARGRSNGSPGGTHTGVQLLPGRFAQLRIAVRLSHQDGAGTFLVGRGFGAAELDPTITSAAAVPEPERTGGTWIGRVLTDAGWLGLAAFAWLLVWLAFVGVALAREAEAAGDRALGVALPFVAVLTAVGAVDMTILDVRGYSIPFWVIVGLAVGAYGDPRTSEPPSTRGTVGTNARDGVPC